MVVGRGLGMERIPGEGDQKEEDENSLKEGRPQ